MKKSTSYSLLFFLVVFVSCQKKELPFVAEGTPVFNADLRFADGSGLHWEAGVDSFYMFTSHATDADGVVSLEGKMAHENGGPDDRPSLTIVVRGAVKQEGNAPGSNDFLPVGTYQYHLNSNANQMDFDTSYFYRVALSVDTALVPVGNFTKIAWLHKGAIFAETPVASLDLDKIGTADGITLRVDYGASPGQCVAWQTQRLAQEPSDRCAVRIEPQVNVDFFPELLQAIAVSQNGPFTFDWSNGVGGDYLDTQILPQVPYSVVLTDGGGCSSEAGFQWSGVPVVNFGTANGCTAQFQYEMEKIARIDSTAVFPTSGDSLQLATVTVIYVDAAGRSFRSDRSAQTQGAGFSLLNVADFDDNERGGKTKKIECMFNGTLWDESGNALPILEGKAVWGVGHPQ